MSDATTELITPQAFERWLLLAAVALAVAGAAVAALDWRSRRSAGPAAVRGVTVALLGPLALALWRLYNYFEDRYGLDSVLALLINMAIFVALGVGLGAGIARIWRRTETAPVEPDPAPPRAEPATEK